MIEVLTTRRQVLSGGLALAVSSRSSAQVRPQTAREIFAAIKLASGQPWDPNPTDDRIIYGDRDTPITGIATCFFASIDVLRQAKAAGLNYIVPHEASFYERYDDFAESALPDADPVLTAKKRFIRDNAMVIQRMHSHAHARPPADPIMAGLIRQLGWSNNGVPGQRNVLEVPRESALDIGRHIKASCGRRTLRMFGDPRQQVATISVSAGMPGENAQIGQMEMPGVDAVLLGEVREPEVLGYAQDLARSRPIVLYLLGHTAEDFGMRDIAGWLSTIFPNLPCRWLPTVDPYTNPS